MAVALDEINERLRKVFTPDQVEVLIDMFRYAFDRLVKASDFAANSVEKNVNFTVALPFNMTGYLQELDQANNEAYGFQAHDSANHSINYTNNDENILRYITLRYSDV